MKAFGLILLLVGSIGFFLLAIFVFVSNTAGNVVQTRLGFSELAISVIGLLSACILYYLGYRKKSNAGR